MTENDLKKVYVRLCNWKGFSPDMGQLKTWKSMLFSEAADLEAAADKWMANETDFPMPALLRPLIESARRERLSRNSEKRALVIFRCPECSRTMSGFLAIDDRAQRVCIGISREGRGLCNGLMNVVHDERAA